MKAEVKQVWNGVTRSVVSAAAAAELSGDLSLRAVGFARKAADETLLLCSNSAVEKEALRALLNMNTAAGQMAAGKLAAEQLFRKWSEE